MKKNILKQIVVLIASAMMLSACSGLMPGDLMGGGGLNGGGGDNSSQNTNTDDNTSTKDQQFTTNFDNQTFTYELGASATETMTVRTYPRGVPVKVEKMEFTYNSSAFDIDYSPQSNSTVLINFVRCRSVGTYSVSFKANITTGGVASGIFYVKINNFDSELVITGETTIPLKESTVLTAERSDHERLNLADNNAITITSGKTSFFNISFEPRASAISITIGPKDFPLAGQTFLFEFTAKTKYGPTYHGAFAVAVVAEIEYQQAEFIANDDSRCSLALDQGQAECFLYEENYMYGTLKDNAELIIETSNGMNYNEYVHIHANVYENYIMVSASSVQDVYSITEVIVNVTCKTTNHYIMHGYVYITLIPTDIFYNYLISDNYYINYYVGRENRINVFFNSTYFDRCGGFNYIYGFDVGSYGDGGLGYDIISVTEDSFSLRIDNLQGQEIYEGNTIILRLYVVTTENMRFVIGFNVYIAKTSYNIGLGVVGAFYDTITYNNMNPVERVPIQLQLNDNEGWGWVVDVTSGIVLGNAGTTSVELTDNYNMTLYLYSDLLLNNNEFTVYVAGETSNGYSFYWSYTFQSRICYAAIDNMYDTYNYGNSYEFYVYLRSAMGPDYSHLISNIQVNTRGSVVSVDITGTNSFRVNFNQVADGEYFTVIVTDVYGNQYTYEKYVNITTNGGGGMPNTVYMYTVGDFENELLYNVSNNYFAGYRFMLEFTPPGGVSSIKDIDVRTSGSLSTDWSIYSENAIYVYFSSGYLNANETFDIYVNGTTNGGHNLYWSGTFHIYSAQMEISQMTGDGQAYVGNTSEYVANLYSMAYSYYLNDRIAAESFNVSSMYGCASVESYQIINDNGNYMPVFKLRFLKTGTDMIYISYSDKYGNSYSTSYEIHITEAGSGGQGQGQTIEISAWSLPTPMFLSHTGSSGSYSFTLYASDTYGEVAGYQSYFLDNIQGISTGCRYESGTYFFDITINLSDVVNTDRENGFTVVFEATTNSGNTLHWSYFFSPQVAYLDYNCNASGSAEEIFKVGSQVSYSGGFYCGGTKYYGSLKTIGTQTSNMNAIVSNAETLEDSLSIDLLAVGTCTITITAIDAWDNVYNFTIDITIYDDNLITETSLYNPLPSSTTGSGGIYEFTLSFSEQYGSIDYAYVTFGNGSEIPGLDSTIQGNNELYVKIPASSFAIGSYEILITGRMSSGRIFEYRKLFDVFEAQVACMPHIMDDTIELHVGEEAYYTINLVYTSTGQYLSSDMIATIGMSSQNGYVELASQSGGVITLNLLSEGTDYVTIQVIDIFGNCYFHTMQIDIH